jgi:hypothetical protein
VLSVRACTAGVAATAPLAVHYAVELTPRTRSRRADPSPKLRQSPGSALIHNVQDESVLPLIATESLHCGSGSYPSWQEGNTALRGGQHLGFGVVRRYHRNSKMETAEQVLIQEDGAAAAQCIVAPS